MIFRLLLNLLGLSGNPHRAHEAQLRAMSDGELSDLGIGRSQIPSVLCDDESWVSSGCHAGLDPASMPRKELQRRDGLRVKPAMTASYMALNRCA
jgi:hypothetical protein